MGRRAGQANRNPEWARREYRHEVMDRHREKSKKSQWDTDETEIERWWRESWDNS